MEVMTWKVLCHPNVLPLMGVTMDGNQLAMVSEWMVNGNITEYIAAHGEVNRFELVRSRFLRWPELPIANNGLTRQLQDVARGLIYMHGQFMVHGDLKGVRVTIRTLECPFCFVTYFNRNSSTS